MSTHEALQRLAALASGLCQDAGIGLETTEHNWAWDPVRRVIMVSEQDLERKGPDYCAGVLAHEVSHYYISRYVWFPIDFPSTSILSFLLNGIEDPRVNTWIRRRYPGTDAWLGAVAAADAHEVYRPALPDVLTFGFECAREEWLHWEPATSVGPLPPRVAAALDQTRPARRRYAETTLPPANLDPSELGPDLAEHYRHDVWPRLSHDAPRALPPPWDQAVRLEVLRALDIAEADILPVARELFDNDVRRIGALLERNRDAARAAREALRSGDQHAMEAIFAQAQDQPASAEPPEPLRRQAVALMEAWLSGWRGGHRDSPLASPRDSTEGGKEDRRPRRPPPRPPLRVQAAQSKYEKAWEKVAPQIDILIRHIEDALRPAKRLRERHDCPSGYRVDLRRAMAWEADPRLYDRLWLRKSIPSRRGTAMSLLIDLSGSMRGEKSEAALSGTILLAEALARLEVPFGINGFQDVLVPFADFDEGLTPPIRDALGQLPQEVEGTRPGGNNKPAFNDDGPCLMEAAEALLERSEPDRVLVVVSDGRPEGRRAGEADLRRAVASLRSARGLTLVGIGLGPNTEHVRSFYPESIANVPVAQFAEAIGGVLQRALLGAATT